MKLILVRHGESVGNFENRLQGQAEYDLTELGKRQAIAERVYPGEEGREAFRQRVTTAIWGVAAAHPGETVAVVSHGGPIALFCQTVLGLPYRRPMPFSIANCSLNIIDVPPAGEAVLVHLNDRCHLRDLVVA